MILLISYRFSTASFSEAITTIRNFYSSQIVPRAKRAGVEVTYDYHGSWERRTNFNAPLYPAADDPSSDAARAQFNVAATVEDYRHAARRDREDHPARARPVGEDHHEDHPSTENDL